MLPVLALNGKVSVAKKPMLRRLSVSIFLFLVLAFFLVAQPVKASPKTIVVPDDYPTINAAIDNAIDGDTILVKKGVHDGPYNQTLTINKTLSILGEDAENTVLRLHPLWYEAIILGQHCGWTYAASAQITADHVVISGFTVESDGGIFWVQGASAQVTGNIIKTRVILNGTAQTFAYNVLTPSVYSNGTLNVYSPGNVDCSGTHNQVAANKLENGNIAVMGSYGTVFANHGVGSIGAGGTSNSNVIYNNTLQDGGGIWGASTHLTIAHNKVANSSTDGVAIAWGYYNTIYCNVVTDCLGAGLLEMDKSGANSFYASTVANNVWGAKIVGWGSTSHNTTLYCNIFINNTRQVNTEENETITSAGMNFSRKINHGGFFDNGTLGNYWSDYAGTDLNHDGIGDTPYMVDVVRSDHYPLMEPFDVASLSIPLPEWANITLPKPLQKPPQTSSPNTSTSPSASSSTMPTHTPTATPEPSPFIPEFPALAVPLLLFAVAAGALAVLKLPKKRR
ncbi:MAG: hypothetical protein NWF00_07825 [Candidatus Bathyarchaeota archaeon]|nr:hypothetical protein [Candidatus Bathyarchaeota archaeon]